jgi:endonuclease/exonuclease/phosphatase (EEP) superfamily protein YafD
VSRGRPSAPTLISLLYAGFLIVWHGLRFTPIGEWWPFELVDIFGLVLFAPLPLLLLMTMLCASRSGGLWLMVPLLLLAWEYGPLFLPQTLPRFVSRDVPTSGGTLRVMTANLLVSNGNLSAVSALMLVERPDVVALQELGPEMAAHLAAALESRYPYQLLAPSQAPDGLGILSRYPIQVDPRASSYSRECSCQRVAITVDGRTLTFVNVHPPTPAISYRRLGRLPIPTSFNAHRNGSVLRAAFDGIDPQRGPLIVLGDFNLSDRAPLYRQLRHDLLDAHAQAGWGLGYTFPALAFEGLPVISIVRIDYILYDRTLAARASHTGTTPGSDHRYVIADLAFR